jgi:hypothetical protein
MTNTLAMGSFVSYAKTELLRIHTHGSVFTTLHFHCNLQMGPINKRENYTKLERLVMDKHFSLLGSFVSYPKNEVL